MGRWGRAAGVAAVLLATAACSSSGGSSDEAEEPRLPTVVNAPGRWSDAEGVDGPVAAIGIAERDRARGIFDELGGLQFFAVSAIDGSASWLPPDGTVPVEVARTRSVAVSPDGRWIAWTNDVPAEPVAEEPFGFPFDDRTRRWEGWLVGWTVMDTATGDARQLRDPEFSRVRSATTELDFSGDSRWLVTSYEQPRRDGSRRTRGHQLVAWDVEDGTHVVLEEPGERLVPIVGSAPTGVVWSRGREVVRADPATGERTTVALPEKVGFASWGPGGSFAYAELGSRGFVHAGRSVAEAIDHEVALPDDGPDTRRLSWQDPTHLVVDRWRTWVDRVDLDRGEVERTELRGYGETFNPPQLATALWERPLREPADPVGTDDPRGPWRWGVLVALVLGCAYVARRVRSGVPPPTSR